MASPHRSLMRLLVLCLLCGASLAATRRYLSVSMDELLMSSKAHLDCPPLKKSEVVVLVHHLVTCTIAVATPHPWGHNAIIIPAVSLKFSDGAVVDLDFFGILIFLDDATAIGCLAFAARPQTMTFNIIGNTQQRSAEVIYDVAAEKIGFVPGSC
ncbi:aspartyl protease family protein At5g10770-like [Panicum virgatum]|uniref:aspartyl protease family protein At5g10770-like n=1 Tax=Panicum virgatum TaxID=38727 RepID=UPI0019D68DD9|nr:aspartyl protease family protein At5g10770-like [Panicum virgatum]